MSHVHEYITLYSVVFVLLGWYLYTLGLLAHINMQRMGSGKPLANHRWLCRNRANKVQKSILTGLLAGFFLYVWYDPVGLDITVDNQRREFALYMAYLTGIGSISWFLHDVGIDLFQKRTGVDLSARTEYEDDGKTVVIQPEKK